MQHRITLLATLLAVTLQAGAQTMATNYKAIGEGNPISASVFCADPTAIDYQGRLYVYGTNDHQQYIRNNKKGGNGYGNIKSLVVFSTDDMVNWTFPGTIDVGKICGSWCGQSWAPSAVWRTTANGSEEFFVYFANGGGSVGVIKGSSPVGPFKSPLSNALIRHGMPGVDPCNWVFDPGVVIDDNGTGWIAFGGGDPQSTGSNLWPGNSRIAKLKPSMIALDGSAVNMPRGPTATTGASSPSAAAIPPRRHAACATWCPTTPSTPTHGSIAASMCPTKATSVWAGETTTPTCISTRANTICSITPQSSSRP